MVDGTWSDDLKHVYEQQGVLDRYFDTVVPCHLFRGARKGGGEPLLQPTLVGWETKRGPRCPDVLVQDDSGASPQYQDNALTILITEGKGKHQTTDIVKKQEHLMVKGCRHVIGDHRGVSVFNGANLKLKNFNWFRLPKGTDIPPGLAITRDAAVQAQPPVHYTIAPKDDMPLSLFLKTLEGLAAKAVKEGKA